MNPIIIITGIVFLLYYILFYSNITTNNITHGKQWIFFIITIKIKKDPLYIFLYFVHIFNQHAPPSLPLPPLYIYISLFPLPSLYILLWSLSLSLTHFTFHFTHIYTYLLYIYITQTHVITYLNFLFHIYIYI